MLIQIKDTAARSTNWFQFLYHKLLFLYTNVLIVGPTTRDGSFVNIVLNQYCSNRNHGVPFITNYIRTIYYCELIQFHFTVYFVDQA